MTSLASNITPGPWNWHKEDASYTILHGKDMLADGVLVIRGCESCHDRGVNCSEPNEGDARLIKNAPELFNKVKAYSTALEQKWGMGNAWKDVLKVIKEIENE